MLEKHLWRDFIGVTSSVAVLGLGLGSTLPLTAIVLDSRGFGPRVVGWMAAAAALGGIAGTLLAPSAAMHFGRRRVMLFCVMLAAASVMPLQYVNSLVGWAALRVAFGASMAPLFVLGEAWINSLSTDRVRGRIVAIYATSFTSCQVLGPALTGLIAHLPAHEFVVCGAMFLLGVPGVALARDQVPRADSSADGTGDAVGEAGLAERPAAGFAKTATASWLGIVRSAPTIIVGAALFAAFDNIMLSFLPLFVLDRGRGQTRALAAVVIVMAGDAALQFAAGFLADRFGNARIHRLAGIALCATLPLLPWVAAVPGLWEVYLFVLGGIAGAIYTLAMVASGQRFSGAALLRSSSLIAFTWSLSSSIAPAATGIVMQRYGSSSMTAVLFIMSVVFLIVGRKEHGTAP